MTYIPEESKVIYQFKDGKQEKVFHALEWFAAMCCQPQHMGVMPSLSHPVVEEGFVHYVASRPNTLKVIRF